MTDRSREIHLDIDIVHKSPNQFLAQEQANLGNQYQSMTSYRVHDSSIILWHVLLSHAPDNVHCRFNILNKV